MPKSHPIAVSGAITVFSPIWIPRVRIGVAAVRVLPGPRQRQRLLPPAAQR